MEFVFKEFRAAGGVADVFAGVAACLHVEADGAALESGAQGSDALAMRMVESLRDTYQRSEPARQAAVCGIQCGIGNVVLGGFGLAFSALWLMVLAVFWPQLNAYANCMSSANTVAAQHVCKTQLNNSVGGEISVLQNGR